MSDIHAPCLTCGKMQIINLDCDDHCIVSTCKFHFPQQDFSSVEGK